MFKLFKFLLRKWPYVILIIACVITQCYLQLSIPEYMGKIQQLIVDQTISQESKITQIWQNGGLMLGYAVGVFACAGLTCYLAAAVSSYIGGALREDVFKKVINMDLSTYSKFGTETLITRTTNDIEQVKSFWLMAVRIMVMSPTTMIIALVKTQRIASNLTIVLFLSIPLVLIVFVLLFVLGGPLFGKIQKKIDNITLVLRESLTGIRVIRAYNQQNNETKKFDDVNKDLTKTLVRVGHIMAWGNPAVNLIFDVCCMGIYAWGFASLSNMNFGPEFSTALSSIAIVVQYASNIMIAFLMFAMVFINLPQASASAKRINEILDSGKKEDKNSINSLENETPLFNDEKVSGLIEFKNVTFQYPDSDSPCVKDLNFVVKPGTVNAIIGSTGSGKSSIINLIPRFYEPTSGEILFDNVNINDINKDDLRKRIGFVPQTALLFSGTIKENIKMGNPDASDKEIMEALDVAQASHFISKTEKGIDSFVSQSGKNFSGGQKQRLAIARAIIRKPELFVFDDSFSALDFKTDIKLRLALKKYINPTASIIIVAQRISTIINADNIIVLNNGKIVAQGKHKELLRNCSVYQDIVKSQLDPDEIEKTIKLSSNTVAEGGK